MPFEVGGGRAWRVHRRGDLIAAMHWVNREPAMVLAAARGSGGAYAIPLDTAHQYVRADGYPEPKACAQMAADVAEQLGIGQDKRTIYQVTELFLDAIPDLLSMPPEPDWNKIEHNQKVNVGELVLKAGDRIVKEVEVDDSFGG